MGLNKRGMPRRFSRGWKVACWWSVEKKEDSHFFGLRGSLYKLDHVSRTVREDWTTEDALSGSGEEDQMARSSAYREAWAPRGKSLVMSSDEEDWTKYQALGDPSSDAEGKAAVTTNVDFSSMVRKERAYQRMKQWGRLSERSL